MEDGEKAYAVYGSRSCVDRTDCKGRLTRIQEAMLKLENDMLV